MSGAWVGVGSAVDVGVGTGAVVGVGKIWGTSVEPEGIGVPAFRLAACMPNSAPPRPSSSTRVAMNATASGLQPRGSSGPYSSYEVTHQVSDTQATPTTRLGHTLSRPNGRAEVRCRPWHDVVGPGRSSRPSSPPPRPPPRSSVSGTAWASSPGRHTDATGAAASGAWPASLAWATWVAATSVVIGAVTGDGSGAAGASGVLVRVGRRLVMALAATIGALLTVPLVALPARGAEVVDNYGPEILAGVFAAAGVLLGLVVALIALFSRAIAANVVVSAVWLWTLATVAVVDATAAGRGSGYAQLGVWKFTEGGPTWRSFYIPGALLMLGAALLIGGLAAFPAAGRSDGRVGVAVSGAFGPLLVAVAYVLAAPVPGEAPVELMSAYHTAPFMVIAGLAGSLLVAAVGGVPARGSAAASARRAAADATPAAYDGAGDGRGDGASSMPMSLALSPQMPQPTRPRPSARRPPCHRPRGRSPTGRGSYVAPLRSERATLPSLRSGGLPLRPGVHRLVGVHEIRVAQQHVAQRGRPVQAPLAPAARPSRSARPRRCGR